MNYKAIEIGEEYLAHHGVKGMKWGIRHDPVATGRARVAKLKNKVQRYQIKRQKNALKLEKRRSKYDTFRKTRRGLMAKKAELRRAKGVHNLGILGQHYLNKSKAMEFKIAKLERKDYLYDKKLNKLNAKIAATKKKLNTRMAQDDFDGEYLSHHGVKGMKWGIRHDPERIGRVKKAIAKVANVTVRGLKRAGKASYKAARRAAYKNQQWKIERAIASGNPEKVSKQFKNMNDQQAVRAVARVNYRDSISRSRIEAGRRSLKNAHLQRQLDTLSLQNQIRVQKHPRLQKNMDKFTDKLTTDLEKDLVRNGEKLMTNMFIGATTSSGAATTVKAKKPTAARRFKRMN